MYDFYCVLCKDNDMPMKAQKGGVDTGPSLALYGHWWSAPRYSSFTHKADLVHLVQKDVWALVPLWTARKISSPLRYDLQTCQPVDSRYTVYDIPTACVLCRLPHEIYPILQVFPSFKF